MIRALTTSIILIGLVVTSGCTAVTLGTAVAAGAVIHRNDRSTGTIIDDNIIVAKIKNKYRKNMKELFTKVSVKSVNRRVLLTGTVSNPGLRIEAIKGAWEAKGVQEVINEIEVRADSSYTIKQYAKDSIITAHAKSRLLINKSVRSVNFNIETIEGVVYVMGLAVNEDERDIVLDIISRISNVEKVISYVLINEDNGS